MDPVIVDTNVALAANNEAEQADTPCVIRCIQELIETVSGRQVLLDDAGLILNEYLRQKPHGFPQGPGDAFLVWIYDNQANSQLVRIVPVTPLGNDPQGFAEFPKDADLTDFDADDRKFVAVALASEIMPKILNATDTDWWIHRIALARNKVNAEFLCPCLMMDKEADSSANHKYK